MQAKARPPITYREHDIVFNPSGRPENALCDGFMILEPSTNPMLTAVLYEHPQTQVQYYGTEEKAYEAAMTQARAWIDARLDRAKMH